MSDQSTVGLHPKKGAEIVLDQVTKFYPGATTPAVENFSMVVPAGSLVTFVGPSGCGKTTTMKMINRIIEPTEGLITIGGEDVLSLDPHLLRRRIGYVIQQIGLFPHMTIAENVGVVCGLLKWDKQRTEDRVNELLHLVGLEPETYAERYPRQLSGGQQQRAGVARALAADPPVMLMDEPFGATDPITRDHLQNEFLELQQKLGKTVIFVTHDFDEALKLGDKIAVLGPRSRIAQYDTPDNILANPADDYVESFVGEGASLRRLALLQVSALTPRNETSADGDLPVVTTEHSLRIALDTCIGRGTKALRVADEAGKSVGVIELPQILSALSDVANLAERG